METILVVDDDPIFCDILKELLADEEAQLDVVCTLNAAFKALDHAPYDLVLLDVHMPEGNSLDRLHVFKNASSFPEIIVLTGQGDPIGAEHALKHGALYYLEKPSSGDSIRSVVRRVLEYRRNKKQYASDGFAAEHPIIGTSFKVQECFSNVVKAGQSNANVLICGETGTGKELFAQAIHRQSSRRDGPFIVMDCTNIPSNLAESLLFGHRKGSFTDARESHTGLFKQADKGTIFLDEIGDLSLTVQRSLLRVLQERRFRPIGSQVEESSDFRLIAATNVNLKQKVQEDVFREDLYYRLSGLTIELPPLRERDDDIILLMRHYVEKICRELGVPKKDISRSFLKDVEAYHWPGNVRELVNTMYASISAANDEASLYPHHLPTEIRIASARNNLHDNMADNACVCPLMQEETTLAIGENGSFPSFKEYRDNALRKAERHYLKHVIVKANGDARTVCSYADFSRARLYQLLKQHDMKL